MKIKKPSYWYMPLLTKYAKVKVFSHNDLDGIGCGIVAKLAFPHADVTYCGYNNIDEKVKEFILNEEYALYDAVFITDISVSSEVEALINDFIPFDRIKLLDHHATAMHLNDFNNWAIVEPKGQLGKNSGTNMLFELLVANGFFQTEIYRDALEIFVEKIRRYDTWAWKEEYDDHEASALNQLLYLYGHKVFEKKYIHRLKNMSICIVKFGDWDGLFDGNDRTVLDVDNQKKNNYINHKEKQMFKARLVGKSAGFVFAEQYISELGNDLSERNPELDFIVIIDMGGKKVSYRTIHDHIDLGKDVAKYFGGGGHPKASGSQIDFDAVKLSVPVIFGSEKLRKQLINVITRRGFLGKIAKLVDKFTKN